MSSPRDSYCDDIGALRRFKLLNENVKKCFAGKNLVSANLIRVPGQMNSVLSVVIRLCLNNAAVGVESIVKYLAFTDAWCTG